MSPSLLSPKPCPECGSDNIFSHGGIDVRGGYGPDLLPGTSGILVSAKMRAVVCKDCGLIRYYAGKDALEKVTKQNGWSQF